MKVIIAIVALLILELYALHCGVNGLNLNLTVAGISGLGGFGLKEIITRIKSKNDH